MENNETCVRVLKFESIFDCSEAVYNNTTVNNIFQIGGQNVSVDRITNSLLYKILVNKNVIKSNAKKTLF